MLFHFYCHSIINKTRNRTNEILRLVAQALMIVYNEIIYELRQARKTTARQLIY